MLKKIKKSIKNKIAHYYENKMSDYFFKQKGFCPCCEQETIFISRHQWLRDNFICTKCNSIPRERALMQTINKYYPNWENLKIHESSPGNRGHSVKLKSECTNYSASQFYVNEDLGKQFGEFQNEDLEHLTYPDNAFDIFVTSDVMEHIYDPEKAFKEIYRILKPGGAHIFSVPLINKHKKTERWANKGANGEPEFLFTPEWHGNPIDKQGSPVTMHWGFDIVDFINSATNSNTSFIEYIDDLHYGIRAEYIEIVITKKR